MFIPCTREKIQKAESLKADVIIFDLEDSIRTKKKKEALSCLLEYLKDKEKDRFAVRVNAEDMNVEIQSLYQSGIRTFMIPKAENKREIEKCTEMYDAIRLILLIETPLGILNLRDLCAVKNISAIAFGAEDYCSYIGMKNDQRGLEPIKTQIVCIAKAYGHDVYDTITVEYKDENVIKKAIQDSKDLGFDGKLYIHPKQLEVAEKMNTDLLERYDEWKDIIQTFDNSNEGVLTYKGKLYEKPHIEYMRRQLYEKKNKQK